LNSEIANKESLNDDLQQQIERNKATIKERAEQLQNVNVNNTSDRQTLRTIERKLRDSQKKVDELSSDILSSKGENKKLEDKIQEEKSKNAQLSLAKVDLESKIRHLEKELKRATTPTPKSPTLPTVQPSTRSEEQSEDPSDE